VSLKELCIASVRGLFYSRHSFISQVAGKLVTTHHTYDRQGMSYKECVPSYNYGSELCDLLGFIYITGTKREKNQV
jgi:hypothetical protein